MNIVVIGAGLSGLVSVIEFFKYAKDHPDQSFTINLIEKRSLEFIRRQKLVMAMKREFGFFSKFPAIYWEEYCRANFNDLGKSQTDDAYRKKFLQKLDKQQSYYVHPYTRFYTLKNFSIKSLQQALYEQILAYKAKVSNLTLNTYTDSEIEEFCLSAKTLQFKCNGASQIIRDIDCILNCEGSKHEVTNIINAHLKKFYDQSFQYRYFNFPLTYHCAVRLKININQLQSEMITQQQSLQAFRKLGDTSGVLPKMFIIDDNYYKKQECNELKLFIASKIPSSIYFLPAPQRKAAIIAWSKQIASMAYQVSVENFSFDPCLNEKASHMDAMVFSNRMEYADQATIEFKNGMKIFLVGDASMTNFYPAGYSSMIALNQACMAVQLVCSQQPLTKYQEMFQFYKNYLDSELEVLRDYFIDAKEEPLTQNPVLSK